MNKTFADVRVGDILYWGAIGMDNICTTILTDIKLNLDGEHSPKVCDVTFKTNDSFEFDICNALLNKNNCIIFNNKLNNNIYIGTTRDDVAYHINQYLENKVKFWVDRQNRFARNYLNNI